MLFPDEPIRSWHPEDVFFSLTALVSALSEGPAGACA
jgi:hypothetical protein